MKEFLIQSRQYGFRVAINNALVNFTKWFIGAKKISIEYFGNKLITDDLLLGKQVRKFYKWADSRNTIPTRYKKAIEWFINSLEEFDN